MARLFLAVSLPDDIKEQLSTLAVAQRGVKWTMAGQHHLTLKFIGQTEVDEAQIIKSLSRMDAQQFNLFCRGVGVFPNHKKPRVLWVGVSADDALLKLQRQIDDRLKVLGIPADDRPFHPHVTLARMKEPDPSWVQSFLTKYEALKSAIHRVSSFEMYESKLHPSGARYQVRYTFPLASDET